MEPLNEHFLKVYEIYLKFQTEIEWSGKKQNLQIFHNSSGL